MATWVSLAHKIICPYSCITMLADTHTITSLEFIKTIFNKQINFYLLAGVDMQSHQPAYVADDNQ